MDMWLLFRPCRAYQKGVISNDMCDGNEVAFDGNNGD